MSAPPTFVHQTYPQRVVFGSGTARTALADEAHRLGGTRILLIADTSTLARAHTLTAHLPVVATFADVREHVPLHTATTARDLATTTQADLLLCIGGGSTTGTAKAIALTSTLPILAVPTTYAGSEVTPVWGLTDNARKRTGTDPAVLPRTVIYDPELTTSLPADLSVASALNAMAHCIDSLWAPHANPISSALAVAGVRALASGLPALRADPLDLTARTDLLQGAYLAALAFADAGSGLHHKICHVLGGAYNLPHAALHAVVLPHVAAFNLPTAPAANALLGQALGTDDALAGLITLYRSVHAPSSLRDLGLTRSILTEAATLITEIVPPSNPRPMTRTDAAQLLDNAWAGRLTGDLTEEDRS